MTEKTPICLDLDNTLFDTARFVSMLIAQLAEASSSEVRQVETAIRSYANTLASSTDFDYQLCAQAIAAAGIGLNAQAVLAVFENPALYVESVFPDVFAFLEQLDGDQAWLFSEGVTNWQQLKVEKSGIGEYLPVEQRLIFRRKVEPHAVARLPEKAIVIDDKHAVLECLAQQRLDLQLVWMRREDGRTSPQFLTVHNLSLDVLQQLQHSCTQGEVEPNDELNDG